MAAADLLIVGPGRLGLLVASQWRQQLAGSVVHLKFRSDNEERTKRLEQQGYVVLPSSFNSENKYKHVVFCAPPTGNEHYAGDVEQAMQHLSCDGSALFVFTSSGSVYGENSGGVVDENAAVVRKPTNGKLIDAEQVVLSKGGCVLRLGGLYAADAGVRNNFPQGSYEVPSLPGGIINFVHYEDAAAAVVAALQHPHVARGQVYLVSDGVPVTRQEIFDAESQNSKYRDMPRVVFTGGPGVDGKIYNTAKIRQQLGWAPAHPSAVAFMKNL